MGATSKSSIVIGIFMDFRFYYFNSNFTGLKCGYLITIFKYYNGVFIVIGCSWIFSMGFSWDGTLW